MRNTWIKQSIALGIFYIAALTQPVYGENNDSLKVEYILSEANKLPADSCKTLFFAKQFLEVPYVGGTLEESKQEELLIDLRRLDCTTFVENIIALVQTEKQGILNFTQFKRNLQRVRYRDGIIKGYPSRLHYMSEWIKDNQTKGFVKERILPNYSKEQLLHLNFMSTHPKSYRQINENVDYLESIRNQENQWQGISVAYVEKQFLNLPPTKLKIKNGDMLALVTTIKGLDVVHVGFAYWVGDRLHLLHASSAFKKVVIDPISLFDYMKNRKTQLGVRVIATE